MARLGDPLSSRARRWLGSVSSRLLATSSIALLVGAQLACKKPPPPPDDDDIANPGRKVAAHVCSDPDALGCHVAHITDPDKVERQKALDSLVLQWKNDESSGKSSEKKAYRDAVVPDLVRAYGSGLLPKDERKKVLELIVRLGDARAKSALLDTLTKYVAGDEDLARLAVDGLEKAAIDPKFPRDEATGKALLDAFAQVKWDVPAAADIGNAIADALGALKIPSTRSKLCDVLKLPNDGQDTTPNKALTSYQVAAARALGGAGDKSVVAPMMDVMFDAGSRMVSAYDSSSGTMMMRAAPLTQSLAEAIAPSLEQLGEPAVDALVPYLLADETDPAVKAVASKYEAFIPTYAKAPQKGAYADLAARAMPRLSSVEKKIDAAVRTDATNEDDRVRLLYTILALPIDASSISALSEGFGKVKTAMVKPEIVASAEWTLDPLLVDWLTDVAKDGKNDEPTRAAARRGAMWLAPKAKIEDVGKLFDARALAQFDSVFVALVPTTQKCNADLLSGDKLAHCREDPVTYENVVFKDAGPTYKDDLALVAEVLACDALGSCYRGVVDKALAEYSSVPSYKATSDSARAGVKLQKALDMLASLGSEDDLVALAKTLGTSAVVATFADALIERVLDVGAKKGSEKIASELEAQARSLREASTPNLYRVVGIERLARKLRARAASMEK